MAKDGLGGRRSDCPINFAVEVLGDRWSLVILRDIVFWGKRTYGELLRSDERIATNVLASRLRHLEKEGVIQRSPDVHDRRKDRYDLTESGIALIPLLVELTCWSARNERWRSLTHGGTEAQHRFVAGLLDARTKSRLVRKVHDAARRGSHFFEGITPVSNPRNK
ncbi:MAG TPA: helix-turn-helix domain-containing protein [Thermoanaerobaculia bacterium]